MCNIYPYGGLPISYDQIRQAQGEEFYTMSLVGDDAAAVQAAVDQGIDSHLEACFMILRGDSYDFVERKTRSGRLITSALDCVVSVESLPVLLRRLFEDNGGGGEALAGSILHSLGLEVD